MTRIVRGEHLPLEDHVCPSCAHPLPVDEVVLGSRSALATYCADCETITVLRFVAAPAC